MFFLIENALHYRCFIAYSEQKNHIQENIFENVLFQCYFGFLKDICTWANIFELSATDVLLLFLKKSIFRYYLFENALLHRYFIRFLTVNAKILQWVLQILSTMLCLWMAEYWFTEIKYGFHADKNYRFLEIFLFWQVWILGNAFGCFLKCIWILENIFVLTCRENIYCQL